MVVDKDNREFVVRTKPLLVELNSPGYPKNVRLAIANVVLDLVSALLKKESDDTKALNLILNVSLILI